ncbi:MAG TPA: hypothetical protein DHV79_01430 [Lachnospiraceae bacterium]|nr:hypothetical protein [Lachnospiraceae bacterium]
MMEAAYETIKDDNSFASILCEIIKSSLYRFRMENSHDPAKRIDYGSVTIVCGLCGERNTLCVEVKADDATTFKKTEKDEKKLTNVFEELLITILKNATKENRAYILQSYIQRYGPLSNEAGEAVKELLKDGEQE